MVEFPSHPTAPASSRLEPLPGGPPLANAVPFGESPVGLGAPVGFASETGAGKQRSSWEFICRRDIGEKEVESTKPERRGQKSCVRECVCWCWTKGPSCATGLVHSRVLPCWSMRTQGRQRWPQVGLSQITRKINLIPQLHSAASSQRQTTFAAFATYIFAF